MVRRPLLPLLVAGLLLATVIAVAGTASANHERIRTFTFEAKEFREVDTGTINWARDTVLTQNAEDANYQNHQYLNVSAKPGAQKKILLRWELDQQLTYRNGNDSVLPPNVSVSTDDFVTDATVRLFYRDTMADEEKGRDLAIHTIQEPWEEGVMTWSEASQRSSFISSGSISVSPATDAQATTRIWDVTSAMAEVLDPQSPDPFYGFAIQDAAGEDQTCNQGSVPCLQEFYSSNYIEPESGEPKTCADVPDNCLPQLELTVWMNKPKLANLTYERGFDGDRTHVISPNRKLNFTSTVWDPAGDLTDVQLEVHNDTGAKKIDHSITQNRSRNLTTDLPDVPSSFRFWWNNTLDLPPGDYVFNMSVRDSDDHLIETEWRTPNVTIEDVPPTVLDAEVGPGVVDPDENFQLHLEAEDDFGINNSWAVLDHPNRRPIRTDTFDEGAVEESGNGTYDLERSLSLPGEYDVTLKVRDRPGNVRTVDPCDLGTNCTIRVRDNEAPTVIETCFRLALRCTPTPQAQEIGGNLTLFLEATDNHPQRPDVTLQVDPPDRPARNLTPEITGSETWVRTLEFNDSSRWPAGEYEARWIVQDPGGNRPSSPPTLTFDLEPARPPVIQDVDPAPWGSAEPKVKAVVTDANLDPDRIDLSVSVNGEGFETVQSTVDGSGTTATVTARVGPFVHNDTVRVSVTATDALDRTLSRETDPEGSTWGFRVDARDPQADVTVVGPQVEGLTDIVVSSKTRLAFEGTDRDSGFDRVEYRLIPDGGPPSSWREATEPVNMTRHPAYRGPGPYQVELRAIDDAGNRGSGNTLDVHVDTKAPKISWTRTPDRIRLEVTDPGAGIQDIHVFYRNGSTTFHELDVQRIQKTPDGAVYEAPLPFTPRGTQVQVYFAATDRLDHTRLLGAPDRSGSRPIRWTQPNHPPDVQMESPDPGDVVSGTVPVVWTMDDDDGDDLSVKVDASPVVLDERRLVENPADPVERVSWDTTEVPDGRYELRVSVQDGRNVTHETVVVDVRNTELGLAAVHLPTGGPDAGTEVPLSVTIYRPVKQASALVRPLDDPNAATESVTLRDDGRGADADAGDATFTGSFTPQRETSYAMGVDILFSDDTTLRRDVVGEFQVETTLAEHVAKNQSAVALAGAVIVFVAAAGVLQLYRYGYI